MTLSAGRHLVASAPPDTIMKLKITKSFPFAHRGCDVVQYTAGQEVDTEDQDLIDTALTEKWATKAREARQNKSLPGAPENKGAEGSEGDEGAGPAADDGDQSATTVSDPPAGDQPTGDAPVA